jgi:hypothetical protein
MGLEELNRHPAPQQELAYQAMSDTTLQEERA